MRTKRTKRQKREKLPINREAFSVAEAAQAAGISKGFLYQCWAAGNGPRYLKIGERRLVTQDALREWLRGREVAA